MSTEYYDTLHDKQGFGGGSREYAADEEAQMPEEGYWQALLDEGEYASAHGESPASTYPTPLEGVEDSADDFSGEVVYSHEGFSAGTHEDNEADWQAIEGIMQADDILELEVIGYNRGGLLVEWRSLRGFVPASQLVDDDGGKGEHRGSPQERRRHLAQCLGETLRLRVIELDAKKNRFILSERAAQVESGTRADILHKLDPGTVVRGCVTNLCDFGAFIDLGGVEGLIHISELSWGRVGHPADILERGQEVDVFVLDVAPDDVRIALSLKRLHPDPWATVHERYKIGEVVEGRITNVVDFGAFACIEEGLEGLIHFSELAEGHFLHPRNVVGEGDVVHARILSIDGRSRRLGLSLRTQ